MTTINVTAEHIAAGERENCERCPVALAIRDAFPHLVYIEVAPEGISISLRGADIWGLKAHVDVAREVQEFIRAFDSGEPVEPFTFELDYPKVAA
jgi:hypothetical protein